MISDSYRILLNGQPAKLFRSGALTVLDLLMMNGYTSADLLGRTGRSLSVTVDGQRMVFWGKAAVPCTLTLNGKETTPSALVYAGDELHFVPAVPGEPAKRTLKDLLGSDYMGGAAVNGVAAGLDTELNTGDVVETGPLGSFPAAPAPPPPPVSQEPPPPPRPAPARPPLRLTLNGKPLELTTKEEGGPYYLLDLLDRSGIDFDHLERDVELQINGAEANFTQELHQRDVVVIRYR